MISHVLVPIDDTEMSIRAVPVAAALARRAGATVQLVTVEPVGLARHLDEERLDEVTGLLPPGVGVSTSVVATTAAVADTLADLEHPDGTVLCLATHGRGPLVSLGLGNVTANLVAQAAVPVLVVGPRCLGPDPADLGGPVLAAVDGSARDEDVLGTAVEWARTTGSPIVATTTVTRPAETSAWSDADAVLDAARSFVAASGAHAEVLPVAAADVDEGVLRAIDDRTACVVMGSHRRGRLGRLLFGSTTAAVVHRAPCPVLVAAPATAHEAASPTRPATEASGGG